VEAARLLGQRMILEGGASAEARLRYGFRLATARRPGSVEETILMSGLRFHLDYFARNPEKARAYLTAGETPADPSLEPRELAAYAAVASLILNLDETITKE